MNVVSTGPADTARIAGTLARRLVAGDVVLLTGDLAAGKTLFVTAAAAALGSTDPVTSPTFALAQFYATGAGPVLHIDAYRITDVAEYRDLGLAEYVESSITFVEWGERFAAEFDAPLHVELRRSETGPDVRDVVVTGSERWAAVLADLPAAVAS